MMDSVVTILIIHWKSLQHCTMYVGYLLFLVQQLCLLLQDLLVELRVEQKAAALSFHH